MVTINTAALNHPFVGLRSDASESFLSIGSTISTNTMNSSERDEAFKAACRDLMDFSKPDARHYVTFLGRLVTPEVYANGVKLIGATNVNT
jgi:hypothetical protein